MGPWWSPFGRVPEVSAPELQDRLMRGEQIQIIDVRTPREFADGHINGAVNVPIQSLPRRLPDLGLDVSKPVVTICKTAHRSVPATRLLRRRGFDASQLAVGLDEWRRRHLPLESD
jgi:rhodanese-related sulfurtransferase